LQWLILYFSEKDTMNGSNYSHVMLPSDFV
jgi:hypothetical protein